MCAWEGGLAGAMRVKRARQCVLLRRCDVYSCTPFPPRLTHAAQAAEDRVSTLEALLGSNLCLREGELAGALAALGAAPAAGAAGAAGGERTDELRAAEAELQEAEAAEAGAGARLAELEAEAGRLAEATAAARAGHDAAKEEAAGLTTALAKEALAVRPGGPRSSVLLCSPPSCPAHTPPLPRPICAAQSERVLEKRRLALRRRDECEAKLRDIGTLPAETQAWEGAPKRTVLARLAAANEELKKYGAVNTKALEQHGERGGPRRAGGARCEGRTRVSIVCACVNCGGAAAASLSEVACMCACGMRVHARATAAAPPRSSLRRQVQGAAQDPRGLPGRHRPRGRVHPRPHVRARTGGV